MSTTLIATIFVFGLLVLFHEFGHFITAKMVGMRVDEFAIGFGPKLISFKHGETLYSLRIIPLGGFNKIAGMDPDEEQDERSYNAKPIWARMLVILAGSFMNFVLPVLIFCIIFMSSGITTPSNEPILGEVISHKSAAQAGLMAGDKIIEIDGKQIASWREFVETVQVSGGKVLKVHFERNGEEHTASMIPEYDETSKRALIGVVSSVDTYHPGILESVGLAFKNTGFIIMKMVEGLSQMFTGRAAADLAGPIGVAQMAGEVAQMGFVPLLQFAAFLSINLGIINLLPVPALDGGHFVTLILEALRGKPLGAKSVQYAQMIGFVLLMGLMIFATFKDIIRLNLFG
ncbi:RIP metalloprotease RseP [Anaerosinus massiliensis]|uniref:RIP metalloprotease RseP n=1 Tax=Massilibacillus massiliensis TaxID=1806837 RepID=UPI000AABF667|nr:RIP metalloprotease RseP [Massilibacillus massiliensis]